MIGDRSSFISRDRFSSVLKLPIDVIRRLSKHETTLAYPNLSCCTPPHSHSILSTHRNALIYKRKFFLAVPEVRTTSRQNFSLMISKENSRDSISARFQRLSTTIGRFFALSIAERILRRTKKDRQHHSTSHFALTMFVPF